MTVVMRTECGVLLRWETIDEIQDSKDTSLVGASEGVRVGPSVRRGIPGTNMRESRKGDL